METTSRVLTSGFDDLADHVWTMISDTRGGAYFRSHAPDVWHPPLNVYETPTRYYVCVEIAGMDARTFDIQAANGALYIRGSRQRPTIPDHDGEVSVHIMEIDSGRFQCKLPLPPDAHTDGIEATYRNGFLWVLVPRDADSGGTGAP